MQSPEIIFSGSTCSTRYGAAGVALSLSLFCAFAAAPVAAQSEGDGGIVTFVVEQADHGKTLFLEKCAHCHDENLRGHSAKDYGDLQAPALKGGRFSVYWIAGQNPPSVLFEYIGRDMPADAKGTLSPQDIADLMAYLLQANGFKPSTVALPSDAAAIAALSFP